MKKSMAFIALAMTLTLFGCEKQSDGSVDTHGFTAPTKITTDLNAAVEKELPLDDQQDFEDARRGLIASEDNLKITDPDMGTIWDQTAYTFMEGKAPTSTNPSLWRQTRLNNIHGLFEVTKGVYQLRGFDLANMTLIEGENGWIVVDTLTAKETAARAWAFAMQHLEEKPISAIIFTHKMFLNMATRTAGIKDFLFSDDIEISGSKIDLIRFFALVDIPKGKFNIVTP